MQLERGDFSLAQARADQGFKESANRDPIWNWKFLILKAEISQWKTDNTEVVNLLTPLPPPNFPELEVVVRAKAVKGLALGYLRKDEEADTLLKEAADESTSASPYARCQVIENQGYHAWKEEQPEVARQYFRQALELSRQFKLPFLEFGALNGLAMISTITRHYDEGIETSFRALDLARSWQFHFAEDVALMNLAWAYQELGDLETALSYYSKREKVLKGLGNELLLETVLNNMGETQFDMGDYGAARAAYAKALPIAWKLKTLGKTDEDRYIERMQAYLAAIELKEGKPDEAEMENRKALALDPNFARGLLISARIDEARGYLTKAKAEFHKLAEKKEKDKSNKEKNKDSEAEKEAFDSQSIRWDAQDELAKISAAERQNRQADAQFAEVLKEVEDFRRSVRVTESRLAFSSHAQSYYDDYVQFLMENRQPQRAFQVSEFSRARTLEEGVGLKAPIQPAAVNIERIQQYLRLSKKSILAYWIAPKESYVWLLSGSQFKFNTLAPGYKIEQAAKDYNDTLLGREDVEKMEQQGQGLYDLLVQPIQQFIPQNAKLVIIPDREVDKLNFETLRPAYPSPHFWIQDVQLQIASSTTMLFGAPDRPLRPDRKLLLIGNPLQASSDYPPLMHADQEMEKVKSHFSPADEAIVSGAQATPEAYAASHPEKFNVVHFVTHGTGSEFSPLDSAIILSLDPQSSFKLYARDIVKTRLNANIVTISACYGAGTRAYSGEGLVGLAWAFLQAGAHRVVAGLWEVDERASVELMDNFYAGIQGGQTPSEALHSAKIKMIGPTSKYNRPLYWAAFQLYMGS